jgi:hypothetical protein
VHAWKNRHKNDDDDDDDDDDIMVIGLPEEPFF